MNAMIVGHQQMRVGELLIGFLSIMFMAVLCILIAYLVYFDNSPPFIAGEVYTLNIQGERQTVFHPGEVMLIHRDLCFTRNLPVAYGRRLVSVSEPKVNVLVNSEQTMLVKGCVNNSNAILIPTHTPPGTYAFEVTMTYSNNVFQNEASKFPAPIIEIK